MNRFYTHVCRKGNLLYHRYVEDGKRKEEYVDFGPTLFFKADSEEESDRYYSLIHKYPLVMHEYDSLKDYYQAVRKYEEVNCVGVYGNISPIYQFISQEYPALDTFNTKHMRILYLDIETAFEVGHFPEPSKAEYPILTMTLYDSLENRFYVLGTKELDEAKLNSKIDTEVEYILCDDEEDLLHMFMDIWNDEEHGYPDMVVGWNSEKFDIPYIHQRLAQIIPYRRIELSPVKKVQGRMKKDDRFFNEYLDVSIDGINHIDFMKFYIKNTYEPRVSYSLDNICNVELGAEKLKHKYDNLMDLYEGDFFKYCHYNLVDVDLMVKLNHKIRLLELIMEQAYLAGVNYADTYSPVKRWDAKLYKTLMAENIVIEPKLTHEIQSYGGGYVMEPVPGRHLDIVSADVNSEYPNMIRSLNIGPETLFIPGKYEPAPIKKIIDEEYGGNSQLFIEKRCSHATNSVYFLKDTPSIFSKMITDHYNRRVQVKGDLKKVKGMLKEVENELKRRGIDLS